MITLMNAKMTDRPVLATCSLGFSSQGTGVSGLGVSQFGIAAVRPESLTSLSVLALHGERPIQAPAVAAVAQAKTYAMAAANGAENQTKHHQMWASRGLEPWSDPT
ncbi:hypothetical protein [Streptomyces sp. NPDC057702]|uniref:hypothetical protein n=1 Tax=unclassified Streptomyces TaxID=2593676 RepID=UPI0036868A18